MTLSDLRDSSSSPGPLLAVVLLALAIAVLATPTGAAARARTFVAGCDNPGFLEIRPDYWSDGCTAGTPYVKSLHWSLYGPRRAVADGTAIVQNCGCSEPTAVGRYPARLTFTRPHRCPDGSGRRYFAKVRLTVIYPTDNPFGEPAGPIRQGFSSFDGKCAPAP
jgi:hypothetical protein